MKNLADGVAAPPVEAEQAEHRETRPGMPAPAIGPGTCVGTQSGQVGLMIGVPTLSARKLSKPSLEN